MRTSTVTACALATAPAKHGGSTELHFEAQIEKYFWREVNNDGTSFISTFLDRKDAVKFAKECGVTLPEEEDIKASVFKQRFEELSKKYNLEG